MNKKDTALFFDIETSAIEDFTTLSGDITVHCLSIYNPLSRKVVTFEGESIRSGLSQLNESGMIVGHNVIGFDLPVLKKVYKWYPKTKVYDTLLMSRIESPDVMSDDVRDNSHASNALPNDELTPKELWGSHSLEAWGYRLGILKGEYGKQENAWDEYNDQMRAYCERDCMVTYALFKFIEEGEPSAISRTLEHSFAHIIRLQELRGFAFDSEKADKLLGTLTVRRAEIKDELQKMFEPNVEKLKSPQCWELTYEGESLEAPTKGELKALLKEKGIKQVLVKDAVKKGNKKKITPFNPASRQQIADRLTKLGWKPTQFHADGVTPKIDESILKAMKHPSASKLLEYLLVTKRLGHLAEGKNGWITCVKEGRIHGKVNTNGAVTGRCTHSTPNIAQVPAVRAEYGEECRELFKAGEGYVLAGTDASGLELRCLAHYLHTFDNGEYSKYILESDIHEVNRKAAGLDTRDQAKTFIYAFLYGAGDGKIGDIINGSARQGRALKERFLNSLPALKRLKQAVEGKVKKHGYLTGLDGRKLRVRSEHSALNTLLQSAGAVVMKQALILLFLKLGKMEWSHGNQYAFVANIHDEFQAEVKPELAEVFKAEATKSYYVCW